jgi:hypothetical protein
MLTVGLTFSSLQSEGEGPGLGQCSLRHLSHPWGVRELPRGAAMMWMK